MQTLSLRHGDCMEVMASMPSGSVGAIVSDPPYGLSFMGNDWDDLGAVRRANRGDHTKWRRMPGERSKAPKFQTPQPAFDLGRDSNRRMQDWHLAWLTEAYRVLKPGGILKAFSGARTFHRLAASVSEAGFTGIRVEAWVYGSGFPKSKNVAFLIGKRAGATGNRGRAIPVASTNLPGGGKYGLQGDAEKLTSNAVERYSPVTPEAQQWDGWGTALKPAWEIIVVGRKPCE